MVVLKQLLAPSPLSRLIVRFHPTVATGVFKGFSPNGRRMLHDTSYAELADIEDAENRYVYIDMAGVKKEDVEASFKLYRFNELKIKGGGVTKDFKHVKYERKFDLPRYTTMKDIEAVMNDGELKLNIPKVEERREKFYVKVN